MESRPLHHIQLDGEMIAELLDQDEYPANIGEVAGISDRQICVLRRDWHELTHLRMEYLDVHDCHAIEYRKDTAYYRMAVGIACLVAAIGLVFTLAIGLVDFSTKGAPLIIGVVVLVSIGVRFLTSTHRHIILFAMPDEVLAWRSPAIDFKAKAGAAHAVREYARKRGILRSIPK
jgi:hypothetical protein